MTCGETSMGSAQKYLVHACFEVAVPGTAGLLPVDILHYVTGSTLLCALLPRLPE